MLRTLSEWKKVSQTGAIVPDILKDWEEEHLKLQGCIEQIEAAVEELSIEDYRMVEYYWEEKSDITAWEGWDEKKALFKERHPELVHVVEQLVIAERTLSAIVKTICSENA